MTIQSTGRSAILSVTAVALSAAMTLSGCSSSGKDSGKSAASGGLHGSSAHGSSSGSDSLASIKALPPSQRTKACVDLTMKRMTLEQRVGQVFMVGTDSLNPDSRPAREIQDDHIGSAFIAPPHPYTAEQFRVITKNLNARVASASTDNVHLFIATDQEGGQVQRVRGGNLDRMPTATKMAATYQPDDLTKAATRWGNQLRSTGINMNLAPVADVVPAYLGRRNADDGASFRQFGSTPQTVSVYATAFARGMAAANVVTATKHFPGLGFVRGNTDKDPNVHDTTITPTSPVLKPFVTSAKSSGGFVMMSSATYNKIDPTQPAVFSAKTVQLLRQQGFSGPTISDDLGAAKAMNLVKPGDRAIRALSAGVDLVLTLVSGDMHEMYVATLSKVRSDRAFAKTVDQAARAILTSKVNAGLVPNCGE